MKSLLLFSSLWNEWRAANLLLLSMYAVYVPCYNGKLDSHYCFKYCLQPSCFYIHQQTYKRRVKYIKRTKLKLTKLTLLQRVNLLCVSVCGSLCCSLGSWLWSTSGLGSEISLTITVVFRSDVFYSGRTIAAISVWCVHPADVTGASVIVFISCKSLERYRRPTFLWFLCPPGRICEPLACHGDL